MLAFTSLASILGCPRDQIQNFQRASIALQPRQLIASAAARKCDDPSFANAIGFGGARGGGKSHWLMAQIGADDCQRHPELKTIILRKVGKSNRENFEDLRKKNFRHLPHEYSESKGVLTFENGSTIHIGHFQHEKDIDTYLGLQYDVVGIEEATTLTVRKYQDIRTCCRTSKNWRPRIYSTTNPGGVGHAWYRKEFILPFQAKKEIDTRFIPARLMDNQFINPGYRREMERLTGWKRRAWLYGDWDISSGQFFTTFRQDIHVIKNFDEGRAMEWFAALDYGFTHYTVALLGCKDGDGNIFIVDEHAERNWLADRHAAAIHAMLKRHQIVLSNVSRRYSRQLARFVAGADMFSRQNDGTTIASQYTKLGIFLRPAAMDRINGWAEVLRLLPLIPFVFHGPRHSRPDIDKSPLNDIIAVNLDHYRLDADYKHGLHYTALPTAWISGFERSSNHKIGSSTAWVTEQPGATAGFLEFHGHGLTSFERAMDRDERLMAVLGSRLLEDQKKVGETAQAIELRQSGENSILSSIATSVSDSLTQVLRWAYWWSSTEVMPDRITDAQALLRLNTDFSTKGLASDELHAIVHAWQSGAISQNTMLELFRRGEILPDGRTNEEETRLIGSRSEVQQSAKT